MPYLSSGQRGPFLSSGSEQGRDLANVALSPSSRRTCLPLRPSRSLRFPRLERSRGAARPTGSLPILKEAAVWEFERQESRGAPRRNQRNGTTTSRRRPATICWGPTTARPPFGGLRAGRGPTQPMVVCWRGGTVWCKRHAKNRLDIIVYNLKYEN